ncbi:MAG: GlsB/YeaQ/YmgE family stress response membrane protein, partial [Rubrobacter sp.]|nr:GlsB/YeaQ/YmgE family stress response membrane protein [Rubrobacter sp.]
IGGFIGRLLGFHGLNGLSLSSILWAIVGAVILLVVYHALVGRRV